MSKIVRKFFFFMLITGIIIIIIKTLISTVFLEMSLFIGLRGYSTVVNNQVGPFFFNKRQLS